MNLPILTLCCALTIAEPQEINIPTQTIANCVEQCYNNCSEIVEDALENIAYVELPVTTEYEIVNHSGMKSYERHTALKRGHQYLLQQYATTDAYGFRGINGRYLCAVGTRFNMPVGQYFDAVLENGTVIPCIVGDIKADIHTDNTNTFTKNGCCLEFIVDYKVLDNTVKKMGDCSYLSDEFNSKVVKFVVYDELNVVTEIQNY